VKLVRNGCAADLRIAFEYERFESRFGEIERGDQSIVTAADNDDVPLVVSRHG
jgi:hypothetical protein